MVLKFKKYLKVISIDVFIYKFTTGDDLQLNDIGYEIKSEKISENKKKYFICDNGKVIHKSFLFSKIYLLQLIGKKGPVIGDCVTVNDYKGKSIYPFVIQYIAKEIISTVNIQEVFIIVNSNNLSSIRGIEKAGFKLHSKLKAKRFLMFYYNIVIQ